MNNPFESINLRLSSIESLLLDLKHGVKPEAFNKEETITEVKFNITQLGQYLGCSIQTIHNLKKDGIIPFYRLGRKVYFKKSEIDNCAFVESKYYKGKSNRKGDKL
jgi:excisionase family DNA binding protein